MSKSPRPTQPGAPAALCIGQPLQCRARHVRPDRQPISRALL